VERAPDVPSEKDLVRRRSGEAEEESMPARRSRRQEAQKPVTGVDGWRWQVVKRCVLVVMS